MAKSAIGRNPLRNITHHIQLQVHVFLQKKNQVDDTKLWQKEAAFVVLSAEIVAGSASGGDAVVKQELKIATEMSFVTLVYDTSVLILRSSFSPAWLPLQTMQGGERCCRSHSWFCRPVFCRKVSGLEVYLPSLQANARTEEKKKQDQHAGRESRRRKLEHVVFFLKNHDT